MFSRNLLQVHFAGVVANAFHTDTLAMADKMRVWECYAVQYQQF
jgi:hypothetical protein